MTPRRLKSILVVATLVTSGIALLTWTQTWFTITLTQSTHAGTAVEVPGETAGPAVAALGLAGLALGGALAIAGRILRVVFGALEVLLGASLCLSAAIAIADPAAASMTTITEHTGVAGSESTHELVAQSTQTLWPIVAIVTGALIVLVGIAVIVSARRWPSASRKFDSPSAKAHRDAADAVDSWDELSRGEDPTR